MPCARCNVTVSGTPAVATCAPDPVNVSRGANQNCVEWVMVGTDYVFTGVTWTGNHSDFGGAVIDSNSAGRSTMTVTDSVADLGYYTYTILFRDAAGNQYEHDPQIHNEL